MALLRTRREPHLEGGARAMEVRLHRAERDAQSVGHLLIGELLEMTERERRAEVRRELGHRGEDLAQLLLAHGGRHQVRNCSVAAVRADVRRRGRDDTRLSTTHGGVYELGTTGFDPSITMQSYADG